MYIYTKYSHIYVSLTRALVCSFVFLFFVDKLVIMFLHSSYFDVDVAYKTIVANYKYRKELPYIFENYDPSSEEMKQVFDNM